MENLKNYQKANNILIKLSKSMNWILSHKSDDICVEKFLESFGLILDVNRVYVFKKYGDNDIDCFYSHEYEWADKNSNPEIDNEMLMHIPCYDKSIFTIHELFKNNESFMSSNIDELNDDLKNILKEQNIKSIILIPIYYPYDIENPPVWGFIGFDDCNTNRQWSDLEINALYALGTIVRTLVYKKEKAEKNKNDLNLVIAKMKLANSRLNETNKILDSQIKEIVNG